MTYIKLNSNYVLKPDEGRTLMMASLVGRNLLKDISDSFTNIIHPIYAMILSFIDGKEYEECINEASQELGVSSELVKKFVEALLDNPHEVNISSKGMHSTFPPYTIVSQQYKSYEKRYSPELFVYEKLDLRMKRHFTPSSITLMFNNICMTNCIYCYQDKRKKVDCSIPLDRIMELIHEAHQLHVNSFDVIGGEFFLYKYWKEVLKELRTYGYNPYLSTKLPLSEEDIKFLSEINIRDIQISLDTTIEEHLLPSLGVKRGYLDRMLNSITLLDKYQIPIMAHSVLTKYNNSIEDMQSVFDALKGVKHLIDWHVVKGDPSLYSRIDYRNIEIDPIALNNIVDYLTVLKKETNMSINIPEKAVTKKLSNVSANFNNQVNSFFSRAFCSGLFSSLYILPNGQVTMCEQLYWNKNFIVGNVLNNSINEVWNSKKSQAIYFIKQEDIPKDSLCHSCNKFEACRSIRQVCYREVIREYGSNKWYYPDPNCPYAKKAVNES